MNVEYIFKPCVYNVLAIEIVRTLLSSFSFSPTLSLILEPPNYSSPLTTHYSLQLTHSLSLSLFMCVYLSLSIYPAGSGCLG